MLAIPKREYFNIPVIMQGWFTDKSFIHTIVSLLVFYKKILDKHIIIVYNIIMKIIITRRIPDELHRNFKVACAKQNISMNKCIIALMKKFVEENNGK